MGGNTMGKISILALIAALLMLAGCKTKYIPFPEYHARDSIYMRVQYDSVYHLDSIFIIEKAIGDTIYIEKIRYRYIYRDKSRTDTLFVCRTDSVRVPIPFERRVEVKVIYWWQKALMIFGVAALLYVLIWIARALKRT